MKRAAFPSFVSERDCQTLADGVALAESEGFSRFDSTDSWVVLRKWPLEALVQKNPHKSHLSALILPFVVHVSQLDIFCGGDGCKGCRQCNASAESPAERVA